MPPKLKSQTPNRNIGLKLRVYFARMTAFSSMATWPALAGQGDDVGFKKRVQGLVCFFGGRKLRVLHIIILMKRTGKQDPEFLKSPLEVSDNCLILSPKP